MKKEKECLIFAFYAKHLSKITKKISNKDKNKWFKMSKKLINYIVNKIYKKRKNH